MSDRPPSIRREFALFGGSVGLLQGARFAYSLAVARVVSPEDFALWALLVALITYAPSLLLGVVNGMAREVPYLLGSNRPDEATADEVTTWWAGLAAMVTIVSLGAVLTASGLATPATAGVVALTLAISLPYQVQQSAFRSQLAFGSASAQQGGMGIGLLVAAGAVLVAGSASFVLAALGYAAVQAATVAAGLVLGRPALGRFRQGTFRRLVGIGFPIMLVGVTFSFFITADRWVATMVLGAAEAAPYALASVIGSSLLVLPSVFSQHTYPRMAVELGRTQDPGRAYAMAADQCRRALLATIPLAVIVAGVAAVLLPTFFPMYADAVPPTVALCLGLVALSAFSGLGNFLNVMNEQWAYFRVQAVSLVGGLAAMAAGALSLGLVGIAIGAALAYVGYGILLARSAAAVRRRAEVNGWWG